jgi:hypothetical protein
LFLDFTCRPSGVNENWRGNSAEQSFWFPDIFLFEHYTHDQMELDALESSIGFDKNLRH